MESLGQLESNNTSKIRMLHSASKYCAIKFEDQCLQIINTKDNLNGLKATSKMKKIMITVQISINFLQCSKEQ